MSANNWATCPRCVKRLQAEEDAKAEALAASYGKVSADEYDRLKAELRATATAETKYELREDYSLGVQPDGKFSVSYHARCSACDFRFSFKHEAKAG